MLICLYVSLLSILNFTVCHWDLILTAAGFLIYSVKATKWGKANSKALQAVTGVIERLNNAEVKSAVQSHSTSLPKAVVDAIEDAVRTVDANKATPTSAEIVLREAGRIKE